MFRKFGTSEDQRVSLDREEDDTIRRTASAAREDGRWTPEDAEALKRENEQ